MSFSISSDDSNALNAALNALNAAITAYGTQGNPTAQSLYEGTTLLPLVTSSAPLAVTLGRSLYAAQITAVQAALSPYAANNVERDRITHELTVPKQLFGWLNMLAQNAADACEARNNAGLIISIFTQVLAAAA